jgi:hypothetical protein
VPSTAGSVGAAWPGAGEGRALAPSLQELVKLALDPVELGLVGRGGLFDVRCGGKEKQGEAGRGQGMSRHQGGYCAPG